MKDAFGRPLDDAKIVAVREFVTEHRSIDAIAKAIGLRRRAALHYISAAARKGWIVPDGQGAGMLPAEVK